MKKKLLIFLTLMFFVPFVIEAEEVNLEWQKSFGGGNMDEFSDIILTEDGGFVAVGGSYSRDFEGLTLKDSCDAIIVKYDKDGNMLWQKNYGGNATEYFYSVVLTADGAFVAVGYSYSTDIEGITNKGGRDAIIVKYDKDGNMLWQKNYGGNATEYFYSVVLAADGGFVAVGYSDSTDVDGLPNKGSSDAIIVKYDKDGNMLWQKNYGGNATEHFYSVVLAADGGFVAVGYSDSTDIDGLPNKGSSDAIIVKYDKDGNMLWKQNWGGTSSERFESIILTEDDVLIAVGFSLSTDIEGITNKDSSDAIVVKYDKDGNMLWQKNWGGKKADIFESIVLTENGFIAVGDSKSTDIDGLPNKGDSDAIIVKYDKDGNMLWQKNYGGNTTDYFYSAVLTADGGFVVVGSSKSKNIEGITNKGYSDVIIVKYSIKYNLENVTPENGTFTAMQQGKYGVITPTPNEGYEVDKIIVKDTAGNEIEVTKLEDGTYSFELNDDVTVEVSFARAFRIDVKDYVNGSANIVKSDDNVAVITPTPDKGYELDKIIVKNSKDEIVEVTKLEDGTYSFELNDDVTLEVLFKEEVFNPKTGMSNIIGLMFTVALCFISGFFVLKNYNKNYEL